MKGAMRHFMAVIALTLLLPGAVAADDTEAEAEVQYLLRFVSDSGCLFVRNGTEMVCVELK